ncbi:hypothetical protein JZ785_13990 [Alicyclobacillus curvatus]|nr:hypothetical protein JZ785_13990 [Alicyclobacillus curvatus]
MHLGNALTGPESFPAGSGGDFVVHRAAGVFGCQLEVVVTLRVKWVSPYGMGQRMECVKADRACEGGGVATRHRNTPPERASQWTRQPVDASR